MVVVVPMLVQDLSSLKLKNLTAKIWERRSLNGLNQLVHHHNEYFDSWARLMTQLLSDPLPACAPKVSDLATPDQRHRLGLGGG